MSKHLEGDEEHPVPMSEILSVLHFEELVRIRHRLKKLGRTQTAQILTDVIKEREGLHDDR